MLPGFKKLLFTTQSHDILFLNNHEFSKFDSAIRQRYKHFFRHAHSFVSHRMSHSFHNKRPDVFFSQPKVRFRNQFRRFIENYYIRSFMNEKFIQIRE
jgi:hypothetical protein